MEQAIQLGLDSIKLGIASQGVLANRTTQAEFETIFTIEKKRGFEISGVASVERWRQFTNI